jgi:hypothetical protein
VVVTIHQPEHLPWLGFCHKATLADVFVLLDVVQFRKNYFQNRNRILGPNGPMWLTVPVLLRGHTRKTIAEMEIHNGVPWSQKWWRSLRHAYGGAPYFDAHAAFFESVAARRWTRLADLNVALIEYLFDALQVRCRLVRASALSVAGARSELLLDICARLGASAYLAGQHGRDYLDESLFDARGIEVRYHAFAHPSYPQKHGGPFVSHLSVVDLLFQCGPNSSAILRGTAS